MDELICWRCKTKVPMPDEKEYEKVWWSYFAGC